jgi:hyperosmotically inducible protein
MSVFIPEGSKRKATRNSRRFAPQTANGGNGCVNTGDTPAQPHDTGKHTRAAGVPLAPPPVQERTAMNRPQLLAGALAAAVLSAAACNRAAPRDEARDAAAQARTVAARAGEQLADGWLTTKIQAQFFADDDIKARYINVSSRDGAVTLKGFVENEQVRQQALQIAKNTDGVRQVTDQLAIGRAPQDAFEPAGPSGTPGAVATGGTAAPRMDDGRITSAIQAKYFLDPAIKTRRVDVQARDGVVTLRGELASEHERGQALLLARSTEGVQRVEDHLAVNASLDQGAQSSTLPATPLPVSPDAAPGRAAGTPAATARGTAQAGSGDAAVVSTIERALAEDAQTGSAGVEVTSKDGIVLLQGVAPSTAVKQRALTIARQTEGVVQVVDRITVAKKATR